MPPRIRLRPRNLHLRQNNSRLPQHAYTYASLATATTPAPPIDQTIRSVPPVLRYPPTQPPSHKPPEVRKTQLHRQYQSLLKSAPLILLFQHNNVRAVELMAIRRELSHALRAVDAERQAAGSEELCADAIKFQIIQTGIFASALRVVEFYDPSKEDGAHTPHATDPATPTSAEIPNTLPSKDDPRFTHGLSRRAHQAASDRKFSTDLDPILSGPLAVVSFPSVSPQHLKAVLSILSPSTDFPAPKRRARPAYHEPEVRDGVQKLLLLGARVEGKVFDQDGTKWVGGIQGGLDGLRGQLVAMLQGMGAGITNALEGASRSLYFTMESRKTMLEDEGKEEKKE